MGDILGDFGTTHSGFRHIATDFTGCRCLLFDSTGNRILEITDLIDDFADLSNGLNRLAGVILNGVDFVANVFGGSACLVC